MDLNDDHATLMDIMHRKWSLGQLKVCPCSLAHTRPPAKSVYMDCNCGALPNPHTQRGLQCLVYKHREQKLLHEMYPLHVQVSDPADLTLSRMALATLFPLTYSYTSKEERMRQNQTQYHAIGDTVYYAGTRGGAMTHPAIVMGATHLPEGVHYVLQGKSGVTGPFVRRQYELTEFAPQATAEQMLNRAIKAGDYSIEPYGYVTPGEQSRLFKVTKDEFARADSRHGVDPGPTWYICDEHMCSCDDFKYRSGLTGGMCKHRMACVVAGVIRL